MLLVPLSFCGSFFFYAAIIISESDKEMAKRSATAEAEVIKFESTLWSSGGRSYSGYEVNFKFRTQEGTTISDTKKITFRPHNIKIRVCYNPQNPLDNDLRLQDTGRACGETFMF